MALLDRPHPPIALQLPTYAGSLTVGQDGYVRSDSPTTSLRTPRLAAAQHPCRGRSTGNRAHRPNPSATDTPAAQSRDSNFLVTSSPLVQHRGSHRERPAADSVTRPYPESATALREAPHTSTLISSRHEPLPPQAFPQAVRDYFAALATFQKHGHTTEGNTRSAFADLLKRCCPPCGWHLVEEYAFQGTGKHSLR